MYFNERNNPLWGGLFRFIYYMEKCVARVFFEKIKIWQNAQKICIISRGKNRRFEKRKFSENWGCGKRGIKRKSYSHYPHKITGLCEHLIYIGEKPRFSPIYRQNTRKSEKNVEVEKVKVFNLSTFEIEKNVEKSKL